MLAPPYPEPAMKRRLKRSSQCAVAEIGGPWRHAMILSMNQATASFAGFTLFFLALVGRARTGSTAI